LEYFENNYTADPNILYGQSGATGTPPKLGWNRWWDHTGAQKTCNISETVQDRTHSRLLWRTRICVWSRIRAFDCYQNQRPWMTLNGVFRESPKSSRTLYYLS